MPSVPKPVFALAVLLPLTLAGAALAQESGQNGQATQQQSAQGGDSRTLFNIVDAEVQNTNAEVIGDIEHVLVSSDGTIRRVVVAVGGFLGMGEKQIELPFQLLKIQKGEKDGEPRIVYDVTAEELANMPAYQGGGGSQSSGSGGSGGQSGNAGSGGSNSGQ